MHLYLYFSLYLYISLFASIPPYLYASTPLYLYTPISLNLSIPMPLYLYTSLPISTPLYLNIRLLLSPPCPVHEPSPTWGSQRALPEELRASRGARGPPARWDAGAPRTLPSAAPPCQDSVFLASFFARGSW